MNDNNFILAVFLSVLILVGWQFFYAQPQMLAQQRAYAQQQAHAAAPADAKVDSAISSSSVAAPEPRRDIIVAGFAAHERIQITTQRLHGSINLRGGRLDDLTLADYRETAAADSPEIVLLSPAGSATPNQPYYGDFGWLAADPSMTLPDADTLWTADAQTLDAGKTVTLSWKNPQGLTFERRIGIDDNYLFTVTDSVKNASGHPVTFYPFGLIARQGTPLTANSTILQEGPLGVFNGTLDEQKYAKLIQVGTIEHNSVGGWFGFTDKYWLVALVPDQQSQILARFVHTALPSMDGQATSAAFAAQLAAQQHKYQTDYRAAAETVADGATISNTVRLFAGAKEVGLLDRYGEQYEIPHFDLAIDFGWFYFLTKPFFYTLDFLAHLFKGTGYGFGLAILFFTVILKLLFFPLQNKAFISMSKMKLLQPQIEALRTKYKEDKMRLNQETMELYKREKVNPLAGCLPVLIQIPVFFALYKVLYVTIEMRQAPFFGWIHDLSAPDPTSLFNLFGLLHWTPPAALMIGAWPIAMGITMYAQQKLNPPAGDPVQQRMFEFLPIIFTFTLSKFPAGLVIYWAWSNLLSIAQQWVISRGVRLGKRQTSRE